MKRPLSLLLSLAALGACTSAGGANRYGFVATLGRDTVSIESITRTPGKMVSDIVDRFPVVRERHSEFDLAPDGSITKMVMDIHTPSGKTPEQRQREVTATMGADSVRISIRDSSGTKQTAFATNGAITVPHVSMMYSVIELEVAAGMTRGAAAKMAAGDSVMFRQFYPDRDIGGPSFVLHTGFVHPLTGGKVELWHDWLSGIGDITVDSAYRMLTYSGQRSTYKVEVKRIADAPDIAAIGTQFAAAEQKKGASELSVRDTARAVIGGATFSIDYGRPLARGRDLLGNVINYDEIWRTGANAATQFTTSAAITLGGLTLAPGTYTLWTAPHTSGADLIVNKEFGQWGTDYDSAHDLGRATLHTETVNAPVEKFTISIVPDDAKHGSLVMEWGTFKWTAPITVK